MSHSNQKAVALFALVDTMLSFDISAEQSMSENYDEFRVASMVRNGMEFETAKEFLGVSPESLVTGE